MSLLPGNVFILRTRGFTGRAVEQATRYRNRAVVLILGLLAFRLLVLVLLPSGLHGDEAQYWAWAQALDWGYYSKPPMVAWVIAATTAVFGDAEWAVRLASPMFHAGTAWLCFLSTRQLFGAQAGFWAAALYILMPGVSLSSSIISTDAVLLFWVALAVYAWVRVRGGGGWMWTITLGAAVGLGLLSKYAMLFLLPALLFAALLESRTRAALLGTRGLVAALTALLVVSPNLVWNARNDFATVGHTGDNANMGDGAGLYPAEWLEFFGSQFGVFGPITFALLLVALLAVRRPASDAQRPARRVLAVAVLTPLVVISVQALLSRANANWTAVAFGVAPVLLAGWAVLSPARMRVLAAGVALNAVLAVVPPLVLLSPSLTDELGFANSVKRQRGWPQTVQLIEAELARGDYAAVAVDQRLLFYALDYNGLDAAPLFIWRFEPRITNHAEFTRALPEGSEDVLLVSHFESYAPYFAADFDTLTPIATREVELGGGKVRRLRFYRASGYNGPRERPD